MKEFRSLSLYIKILVTTILLTLGATIVTAIVFISNDAPAFNDLVSLFYDMTKHVVEINSAVVNNKSQQALQSLDELKYNPHILTADIYSYNGDTFTNYPPNSETATNPLLFGKNDKIEYRANFFKKRFKVIYPITRHGKTIAALYIKSNSGNHYIMSIFEALIFMFFIVFIIAIYLEGIITRPLKSLINTMKNVTLKNDFSLRIAKKHNDDIGGLADAFNSMLDTIQENENLQRASQEQITKLALYDSLTRLPNKDFYKELLHQALNEANACKQQLAVLYFGIDNFKLISDSLGFIKADSLLIKIAETLQKNLRTNELVPNQSYDTLLNLARINTDTFVTTLLNTSPEQSRLIATRLLKSIDKTFQIEVQEISISGSIGIALFPADGENTDDLLNAANIALSFAKLEGNSQIKIFNPEMNKSINNRMWIENDLNKALEKGELFLQYQPKYNLKKKLITGFEALIRWQHTEKGVIPPEQFIPIAENSGLIVAIGTWLFRQVCKECKYWHAIGFPELNVALNISAKQIEDPLLVEKIKLALEEFDLAPHFLEIELTENIFLLHDERTLSTLRNLKNIGVKISLDDFGTGYSSLRYLTQYPIDKLKIDKLFVKYLSENATNTIITKTIIDLAHNLNLTVIAEGVETDEQFDFLKLNGCDEVQGYLLSPPVSTYELKNLLSSYEGIVPKQEDSNMAYR